MEKWLIYAKKADFQAWAKALNVDPVVARVIRNRDVTDLKEAERFLRGTLQDCHSPYLLKDMDRAVEGLLRSVRDGKKIRVIGDYDVDGISSSYVLYRGFTLLGAKVDVAIPHRIRDGYGLNENLIREAASDGVGLIVTCDNGISASEQILLAGELGLEVIVTDHHEVPFVMEGEQRREILPQALAVVDPKREDDEYPFSGICGGVVAYKYVQAILERLQSEKDDRADKLGAVMDELLEFAALATVCDIMELKDENRILVREGLRRMRNSGNRGLRALMEVNGLDKNAISAYHLGFVIGPCLNATGRLDTARRALDLLESHSEAEAVSMARDLKELNDSRKNLTLQGVELAQKYVAENQLTEDKVLVIYLPEIHESLAGIIAGRIREQYGRPTFVLTKGEEGVKGSGRSIEHYDMYEALTLTKHFLTKYGGHKMAAGLSMEEKDVESFRREVNANCKLSEEDFVPCLHVDAAMPMEYATEDLAGQLEALEPFGVGNPKPVFAQKNVEFLSVSRMGKNGQYGRFQVLTPSGKRISLTYFGELDTFVKWLDETFGMGSSEELFKGRGHFRISVAYQLGMNSFRGRSEMQFLMKSYC